MEPIIKPWQCNAVQLDRIWKDHVHHEEQATLKWEENWGTLTTDYSNLKKRIEGIPNRPPRHSISGIKKPNTFKLPKILNTHQKVSAVPFIPIKTSQEVGWRQGYILEKYGKMCRPKGSILKQLNWPADAMS